MHNAMYKIAICVRDQIPFWRYPKNMEVHLASHSFGVCILFNFPSKNFKTYRETDIRIELSDVSPCDSEGTITTKWNQLTSIVRCGQQRKLRILQQR